MKLVKGGHFWMGDLFGDSLNVHYYRDRQKNAWWQSEVEEEKHCMSLADYYIGISAVTFDEFDIFCDDIKLPKPSDCGWGRGARPVINISWYEAIEFCNWKSYMDGYTPCYKTDKNSQGLIKLYACDHCADGYRLPSEFEWEFAARERGKKIRFGNGKDIALPEEINFNSSECIDYCKRGDYFHKGESLKQTIEVKTTTPNSLGLYEMSGNVEEMCKDWYYVFDHPYDDLIINVPDYSHRVWYMNKKPLIKTKGGSWADSADSIRNSSYGQYSLSYDLKTETMGFRLARNA